MPDRLILTFEPQVLYQQAQGNANTVAYLALAFAREHGVLDEFIAYMGTHLARGWASMQEASVEEIVKLMAMNLVASGGELRALVGADGEAEAVVAGWPDRELLAFCSISQEEADRALAAWYDAIADSLSVNFRAQRQADALTLRVYR